MLAGGCKISKNQISSNGKIISEEENLLILFRRNRNTDSNQLN